MMDHLITSIIAATVAGLIQAAFWVVVTRKLEHRDAKLVRLESRLTELETDNLKRLEEDVAWGKKGRKELHERIDREIKDLLARVVTREVLSVELAGLNKGMAKVEESVSRSVLENNQTAKDVSAVAARVEMLVAAIQGAKS